MMSIEDIIPSSQAEADAHLDQIGVIIRERLEGNHGKLSTKINNISATEDCILFSASLDVESMHIGSSERALHRIGNGSLQAEHRSLTLVPVFQGQGFALLWNDILEGFYRDAGIDHIVLEANMGIGGYAWARHGYDFGDDQGLLNVMDRLGAQISRYDQLAQQSEDHVVSASAAEQVQAARELIDLSHS